MDFPLTVSGTQTVMTRGIRMNFGSDPCHVRVSPHPDGYFDVLIPSGVQPNFYFEQNLSVYCFGDEVTQRVIPAVVNLRQMGLMNQAHESTITLYCRDGSIALDPQGLVKFEIDQRFIKFLLLIEGSESYNTNKALEIISDYNLYTFRGHARKFNNWVSNYTHMIGKALDGGGRDGYILNPFIKLISIE